MRKSCKFRGSEIAKKGFVSHVFAKWRKTHFQAKMMYETERNKAKRSEKRPKEVKKRGHLIEKQKAHEKIGQL
jgi:hypothetical protein